MSDVTVRDFRANMKEYLDRIEAGEVVTLRHGRIHVQALCPTCGMHSDHDVELGEEIDLRRYAAHTEAP